MPELAELEKRIKKLEKDVAALKKANDKLEVKTEKAEKMAIGSKEHIMKTMGMGSSGKGFGEDKINKLLGK